MPTLMMCSTKLPSDTNITIFNNQPYLTDSVRGIIGIVNHVKSVSLTLVAIHLFPVVRVSCLSSHRIE